MKTITLIIVGFIITIFMYNAGIIIADNFLENTQERNVLGENTETSQISIQLTDVNNKISELPKLEKDIFTKCMEGKRGTPQDIKQCEENIQKQMFVLSQDLINLKTDLEKQMEVK